MVRRLATVMAAATALVAGAAQAGAVTVRVSNVGQKGALYVQLCTEAEYGKGCALHRRVEPRPGETLVDFPAVAPGAYLVGVIQDVDGDGRLSFGLLGGPSEPWGNSRGAKAVMGPAAFKDAVVTVGPGPATIPVALGR